MSPLAFWRSVASGLAQEGGAILSTDPAYAEYAAFIGKALDFYMEHHPEEAAAVLAVEEAEAERRRNLWGKL